MWRVDLPWVTPPLSLNDREHWGRKAAKVSHVRETTGWLVKAARIPAQPRIHVVLHYLPGTAVRRDRDNLVATLKPCIDGIVDAGVVPDDDPAHVESVMPIVHPPERGHAALWLQIEALT